MSQISAAAMTGPNPKNLELNPGLSRGWEEPNQLRYHWCISRKLQTVGGVHILTTRIHSF